MALVVSAETARAQIISLVQQAEAYKADFLTFVAAEPPTSLSRDDRMVRIGKIIAKFQASTRSFAQLSREFDAIRIAHQHLPAWKGNNQGSFKYTDRNALSTIFTTNRTRVKEFLFEMSKMNVKANSEFTADLPHDYVPLFTDSDPSF